MLRYMAVFARGASPLLLSAFVLAGPRTAARQATVEPAAAAVPTAELARWPLMVLPGRVDSNSPAVWDRVDGYDRLHLFTSIAGHPSRAVGASLQSLGSAVPVALDGFEGGGYWLEAVVADDEGTLYGYFHNERPATACRDGTRMVPRLTAGRSRDHGATWEWLGVLLETTRATYDCGTTNKYFVGGVGDMSVMLDPASRDLYVFYSEYSREVSSQGVGVGRLLWADRDEPEGRMSVWRNGVWRPAREIRIMDEDGGTATRYLYPSLTPLYPTSDSWHDGNENTDAFWGPSVHWNTYLQQYVMLLNRARNGDFDTEGIYVSFSPVIDDPARWSPPQRILRGGSWYPQVVGLEAGAGTDKVAGQRARFYLTGRSEYMIEFSR